MRAIRTGLVRSMLPVVLLGLIVVGAASLGLTWFGSLQGGYGWIDTSLAQLDHQLALVFGRVEQRAMQLALADARGEPLELEAGEQIVRLGADGAIEDPSPSEAERLLATAGPGVHVVSRDDQAFLVGNVGAADGGRLILVRPVDDRIAEVLSGVTQVEVELSLGDRTLATSLRDRSGQRLTPTLPQDVTTWLATAKPGDTRSGYDRYDVPDYRGIYEQYGVGADQVRAFHGERVVGTAFGEPMLVSLIVPEQVLLTGPRMGMVAMVIATAVAALAVTAALVWIAERRLAPVFDAARRIRVLVEELAEQLGASAPSGDLAGDEVRALDQAIRSLERSVSDVVGLVVQLHTARDQALEASKLKSRFLANVSHELRTPLNAILGYSELLIEGELEPSVSSDVARIQGAASQLLELINDVLDLARIENDHLELEPSSFQLADLVADLRGVMAPIVRQTHNELRVEVEPAMLYHDHRRLRQVVLNLLSNAMKFTDHGTVTLRAGVVEERVRIEVEDTGIGIPAERLPTLFHPFVQAHHDHPNNPNGTGLGLALVAQLARIMGGAVSVRSEAGKGSTFTLVVPVRVERGTVSLTPALPERGA